MTRSFHALSHIVSISLLLTIHNRVPGVGASELTVKRDDRESERDFNETGETTAFPCDAIGGKFRDTSSSLNYAVVRYAYEMEYVNNARPNDLASSVTHHVAKGIIASQFEACIVTDRRRIQSSETSLSSSVSDLDLDLERSLAGDDEIIVGFETTEVIVSIGCFNHPNPDSGNSCDVVKAGITVYFKDGMQQTAISSAVQEILEIVEHTINENENEGGIPSKVPGIEKLTYIDFPTILLLPTGKDTDVQTPPIAEATPSSPSTKPSATSDQGNPVIATSKATPDEDKGNNMTVPLIVLCITMLVVSVMGGLYVRKRHQMREDRRRQDDIEEANDVLLDSYVPTREIIQPLATDQGVVEVVLDMDDSNMLRGSNSIADV